MECNRDCFNCPFDDCIQDDISDSEIASIEKRNSKVSKPRKPVDKKKQEMCKRYYEAHKAERVAYQKAYYRRKVTEANKDSRKCTRCFKPLEPFSKYKLCDSCREHKRIYQNMKYRQKAI